ncbi:MAG: MgtC/SapB family protein [Anaerolineae bacterium]
MSELIQLEPWWRFAVALLLGALIGLEREFIQQHTGTPDFAGIRTFSLIALLGAVTAFLVEPFGLLPLILSLGGVILLVVASYAGGLLRTREEDGITTEVAVLLTFLFGSMVVWDLPELAAALAVITALLLSLKLPLHETVRRMSTSDLRVTLEFGIVSLVILPLLPNETFGPYDILNPFQIWLFVVFISGIGFAGYVLMKVLGAERGTELTGLLGGIVSSTATTLSFASRSREMPELSNEFARAIVLSSTMMVPRVLVLLLVVGPAVVPHVLAPLGAMLIAGIGVVLYLRRRQRQKKGQEVEPHDVQVSNPLKLTTAVTFGLMFAVVLMVVQIAQVFFGTAGVYIASLITGLTDVNAITLSAGGLATGGQITTQVAAAAAIIAALTNTLSKAVIAAATGAPELRRIIVPALGTILLVGTVSGGLMMILQR